VTLPSEVRRAVSRTPFWTTGLSAAELPIAARLIDRLGANGGTFVPETLDRAEWSVLLKLVASEELQRAAA
jgi:hypothetical protein